MATAAEQTNVLDLAAARDAAERRLLQAQYDNWGQDAIQAATVALVRATIAAETPQDRIKRLHREAADLDARAEPMWKEASEWAGKAQHRRNRGETELADRFQRSCDAAQKVAAELEERAFALKLEAAGIMAQEDLRAHLTGAVRSIGGR